MRILVVGDAASIHTARFVRMLQEIGHEIEIFHCEPHYGLDEHLHGVRVHVALPYLPAITQVSLVSASAPLACIGRLLSSQPGLGRVVARALYALQRPGRLFRARALAQTIRLMGPTLVISLKMQNEAYTVAEAKRRLHGHFKAQWIHFSWGTDIEFFGRHPAYRAKHKTLIRDVLERCNYHIADTQRDLREGRTWGFSGVELGAMPASGGFDLDEIRGLIQQNRGPRDVVLIKGRQGGYVGKAMNILHAIASVPDSVRGRRIRIFMATPDVASAALSLRTRFQLDVEIVKRISYRELLSLYARSAIAVSATDVDGTPAFLLEAMAMGAFPIHSDMESVREWIKHGENGLLFPVDSVSMLADCIQRALASSELLEKARQKNWEIIYARANRAREKKRLEGWLDVVCPQVVS